MDTLLPGRNMGPEIPYPQKGHGIKKRPGPRDTYPTTPTPYPHFEHNDWHTPVKQECIPVGCIPSTAVAVSPATHASLCHACPCHVHPLPCMPPLPCMLPLSHMPHFAMHTQLHHMCPPLFHTHPLATHAPFTMHPPFAMYPPLPHMAPPGQNDRCLWKHYLSATTVAVGNNHTSCAGSLVSMPFSINALKSPCLFWCCTTNGYMITVHLDPGVVWPRRRITTDCWWIRQNSLVTYKHAILCFPSNCRN